MKRYLVLLLAGLGLVVGAWSMLSAGRTRDAHHRAYSVAKIQQMLTQHPDAWAGKTVWVRGVAESCGYLPGVDQESCLAPHLVDAASPATVEPLWLAGRDQGWPPT